MGVSFHPHSCGPLSRPGTPVPPPLYGPVPRPGARALGVRSVVDSAESSQQIGVTQTGAGGGDAPHGLSQVVLSVFNTLPAGSTVCLESTLLNDSASAP